MFRAASLVLPLLALLLPPRPAAAQSAKSPLLVLLGGDARAWESMCAERSWRFLEPKPDASVKSVDQRIKAVAAEVEEFAKRPNVDPDRIYLAGQGGSASSVFYMAARVPDLWAAAVAAGGSPRSAIDSNRLYAANTVNLPVLWLFSNREDEALGKRLKTAGYNLESRELANVQSAVILDWLAGHRRDPFPTTADCETGTPIFPRCYWIDVTKFDPTEANDVLDSTRVQPLGSGAVLGAGPFGYDPNEAGPGVLVASLPDKYSGPLKVNDRILEMGGKQLKNGEEFASTLYRTFEEKPVVLMVQRGKEHVRVETRIELAPRAEPLTARVRAQFLPDMQEVEVISRSIAQLRLNIPAAWLPAKINWNGSDLVTATAAGCWLLDEQQELLTAKPCP